MKRIIFTLLIAFSIVSCNISDEPGTELVIGNVEDVTMASAYKVDSISHISIRYKRPTDCHIFNGFYVVNDNLTRTVAVEFAKVPQSNCGAGDNTVYEVPLDFQPGAAGTYLFRFWNGRTSEGIDTFVEYEAIVVD